MNVLILGGYELAQSARAIAEGFAQLGYAVQYMPTRGVIREHIDRDRDFARHESRAIRRDLLLGDRYADDDEFRADIIGRVQSTKPRLLLWWCAKNDRPEGVVETIGRMFPWCATVYHTQDDPVEIAKHPEYSEGFTFAVTCCKASVPQYERRGIRAAVIYPPPIWNPRPAPCPEHEQCDLAFTCAALYDRARFPAMLATRQELIGAIMDLGTVHIYGGLGLGAFDGLPRAAYRGWREYEELAGVYRGARICLNHHHSPNAAGYLNQRDTAITGAGGFMLTDHVEGVEEVFDVGAQIDTWRTLEELCDKARWWLAHDAERARAARSARERVLREHGARAFARRLVALVEGGAK